MNAIQMRERIDEIIDRSRTSRHTDKHYYNAINAAILLIVKDRMAPIKIQRGYSVQSANRLRDELYTLIPDAATGSAASGVIAYPANYFGYLIAYVTIDSVQQYCQWTTYAELGPLKRNPHTKPSAVKPYINEYVDGLKLHYGAVGTLGNYELWYVENPDTVSIGEERDKIITGGTLTAATTYYVYEEAVYSDSTYYPGETITGSGATLTSGTVIISTKITDCNLPVNMHEEVCLKAASLLSMSSEDYNKQASGNSEMDRV